VLKNPALHLSLGKQRKKENPPEGETAATRRLRTQKGRR
jgi:hypothetical protein